MTSQAGSAEALVSEAISPPAPDYGLLGLILLAQFHGIAADPAQLAHQYGRSVRSSTSKACSWRLNSWI